jgi:hypothetical protein
MKDTLVTSNNAQPSPCPPDARAAINRANSQQSTGPRTDAGKKRSSLNALRHGLTGHTIVMPAEDLTAYHRHTQRFFADLKPNGALEEQLVQTLADTAWRLNRVPALETNLLTLGMNAHSESVDTDHPEVRVALATAQGLQDNIRTLSSLSMHEHRLTRKFDMTLKQLTSLQANRREREKSELENAGDLLEMHKEEELPYDPTKDGFVFTNDEIATHIDRKQRLEEAGRAAVRRYLAS